jgi:hypothetical protein
VTAALVASLVPWLFAAWLLSGCGGADHGDHYQRALSKEEACCNYLTDEQGRADCHAGIVRVPASDKDVAASDANQATYRCVESHFECDRATGTITAEASQEVFDCVAALGQ